MNSALYNRLNGRSIRLNRSYLTYYSAFCTILISMLTLGVKRAVSNY